MSKGLIIFDFDGTLGDTRRNIVTTMQMTIAELHLPHRSEEECAATIGLPLAGYFRTLFPDIEDELISRCAETYRRFFNENLKTIHPEAFPGVVETLAILHQKGYVLTIASSRSRNSLMELTRNMGIANYISYILGADDVNEAKPKPEPVLKTLADMYFDAGETLVVGDMAVDIQMGANAGTKTCGVTWGNGTREELEEAGATFIIDRMEDLIEIANMTLFQQRNGATQCKIEHFADYIVQLVRLSEEHTIAFKEEMQEAFQHGFMAYYKDDNQWQVLPDKDFYQSLEAEGAEAYEAISEDGQRVGGAIITANGNMGQLAFLYVKVGVQSKGIGQSIWKSIEAMHPEIEVWETCTPYFDRRNIHFYINRCGFHAVEFFNEHHPDPNMPEQFDQEDGLFKFEKRCNSHNCAQV